MKSPTRPRDATGDLPEEARSLLRQAARPAAPSGAERAMMAAMAARIAALPVPPGGGGGSGSGGGGGGAAGAAGAAGAWSKVAAFSAWKGVGVAGVLIALGGTAWLGVRSLGQGERPATAAAVVTTALAQAAAAPPRAATHADNASLTGNDAPANNASLTGNDAPANNAPPTGNDAPANNAPPTGNDAPANNAPLTGNDAPANNAPLTDSHGSLPGAPAAAAIPSGGQAVPALTSACPSGPASPGDRSAEAAILAAAARALAGDPGMTLTCLGQLTAIGGPWQLHDEHTYLAFDASRRLGRDADARRHARALLRSSPTSAYAARARAFLGDDAP